MEFASTVEFAQAARALGRAAARHRLIGPSYRCPPRLVGVDRTIRRRGPAVGGAPVVSVRVRGRPREAVLADMVEGVVVANGLGAPEADRVRNTLWEALVAHLVHADEGPHRHAGAA
ncbi:hypothetical protein [Ilumatobacter sp.]|uniref:hypothetical protein n=1 Tax=Ilumatobacter sp. TaxID=1967498 RepID=UPI003B515DCB